MKPIKMMFSFLLIFMMLLTQGISFAQEQQNTSHENTLANQQNISTFQLANSDDNATLLNAKLQLELKKLTQEVSTPSVEPWLQFGTLLTALIAAVISFWSAWHSQKTQAETLQHQLEHQKNERITNLLNELGSENDGVKIAAIQSLSDYPNTHRFLVNILKYENDPHVIDAATAALQLKPSNSLTLLISSVNLFQERMLLLACKLVTTGMSKSDVVKKLGVDNSTLTRWIESSRGKRVKQDLSSTLFQRTMISDSDVEKIKEEILDEWDKLNTSYKRTLDALEAVIDSACKANQKHQLVGVYLKGIILDGLNLEGWSFHQCDLQHASFQGAICNKCDFSESILDHASFVSAQLIGSDFTEARCKSTSFSRASIHNANFNSVEAYNANFVAAKGKEASFFNARMFQSKFNAYRGIGVDFKEAILKEADFTNASLRGSIFQNTDLRFAKLSDASLNLSFFIDARLEGAVLKNTDFSEARIEYMRLDNVGEHYGANFTGVKYNDVLVEGAPETFMALLNPS